MFLWEDKYVKCEIIYNLKSLKRPINVAGLIFKIPKGGKWKNAKNMAQCTYDTENTLIYLGSSEKY